MNLCQNKANVEKHLLFYNIVKIGIIGAGNLGTAYAIHLANLNHGVSLFTIEGDVKRNVEKNRENAKYLPGYKIPLSVSIHTNYGELKKAEIVFLCIPSTFVLNALKQALPFISKKAVIVNASKGFDPFTASLQSQAVKKMNAYNRYVVLGGPGLAVEIVQEKPTVLIAAGKKHNCEELKKAMQSSCVKILTTSDVVGVECCEAYKNVAAIALGVSNSLELGSNFKGIIATLAIREMTLLVKHFGGKTSTVDSVAGIGDLITTGLSETSRNYKLGYLLGQGKTPAQAAQEVGQTTEGTNTCKLYPKFARKMQMPLFETVYNITCLKKDPKTEMKKLFEKIRG